MNQRILVRQQTHKRHSGMQCKSYLLKIDKSHLSKSITEQLRTLFLEAKWFVNYTIANGVFKTDYKINTVQIKVGEEFEDRDITTLSSQMKQSLVDKLKQDIKNLAAKKKNGHKVGKLKFKRYIRTIPLKQFGVTYNVFDNRIKIQKINKTLRVRGVKQIPKDIEYANAFLIQDHGDYYLRTVTYQPYEKQTVNKDNTIGIDFGLRNQMTFSNGVSLKYRIPITKRIKKLHQNLSKTQKGSSNRYKAQVKLQKEFYVITNKKDDVKNRIVAYLKNHYSNVCYQNDNIKEWQHIWGRKILDISIGGIKDILNERILTPIAIPPNIPTTQKCHVCGTIKPMPIDQTKYVCGCGMSLNRDMNAAINIMSEWTNQLPTERRKAISDNRGRQACGEEPSTFGMLKYFNSIPRVKARLFVESGSLNA